MFIFTRKDHFWCKSTNNESSISLKFNKKYDFFETHDQMIILFVLEVIIILSLIVSFVEEKVNQIYSIYQILCEVALSYLSLQGITLWLNLIITASFHNIF